MLEFISVDHPALFPQACVACLSQKGPLVDTHAERPGFGHIYICDSCAKSIARIRGYAPGAKLDELEAASRAVTAARRELILKSEKIDSLTARLHDAGVEKAQDIEQIEFLVGRVQQLEAALRQEAESALAAVGDAG